LDLLKARRAVGTAFLRRQGVFGIERLIWFWLGRALQVFVWFRLS